MRKRNWALSVAGAAILMAVILAGVMELERRTRPVDGQDSPFNYDAAFADNMMAAVGAREPVALGSLTDFAWTSVSIFNEGASPEQIEEVTGRRLLEDRYTVSANLFIFCHEGAVVEMVPYIVDNFGYGPTNTFSPDALLQQGVGVESMGIVQPPNMDVEADCGSG